MIRSRSVSPVEVAAAYLQRIETINPSLNAIVTPAPDVIDQARAAETKLMSGDQTGPLHGVPVTIKDTIDTQGLRTTSGSRLRAEHLPDRDATVVARLKAAGAIILGKTNTPEMAIPYETDNPIFGRTNNPCALERTPGGSSGGEAAAIAACLSPAGLGSDLSGSIRVPAHFCGVIGLKPTAGRVPMDGHVPQATGPLSLGACIGPMARRVEDLDLLFSVTADTVQFEASNNQGVARQLLAPLPRGLKVSRYLDDRIAPVSEETVAAIDAAAIALQEAGLNVGDENPPGFSEGARLWIALFARAAREQLRDLYQGREADAGALVTAALQAGGPSGDMGARIQASEDLAAALVEREHLREEILRWMKSTPLVLMPVGATPAFPHGATRVGVGVQSVSIFRAFSHTLAANVFGLPSVVVPAGRSPEGLPIGVQIIGRPFEERAVLAAAAIIQESLGGWQRPPAL